MTKFKTEPLKEGQEEMAGQEMSLRMLMLITVTAVEAKNEHEEEIIRDRRVNLPIVVERPRSLKRIR